MKNLSSNFTVTSRDRHQFIFRNKTDPPDVGKYNPISSLVIPKVPEANFNKPIEYSQDATQKKIDLEFNQTHICNHLIKNICAASGMLQSHKKALKSEDLRDKKKHLNSKEVIETESSIDGT